MLIVLKTNEKMVDPAVVAEALRHLSHFFDVDSFDIYNDKEYGIAKKIPVFSPESLAKAFVKEKEHFTAAEVRGMSLDEVGANYEKILNSITRWGGTANA